MSWHFSRALVVESLGGNSSDGEPSVPSNGTPTHGTFWSPDKTTDASPPSRSGMTFRPSTDAHGEAVLMWCLAGSHARTLALREQGQESTGSVAECGDIWRESSVRFDRNSHSWKTHRLLWEEDLPESSVILPRWGMMRDGELWERDTPELLTKEIGSGYWRSPAAQEPGISIERLETRAGEPVGSMCRHYDKETGRMAQIGLSQQVRARALPTPSANEARNGWQDRSGAAKGKQESLTTVLQREMGRKTGEPWNGGHLNPAWTEWLMGWPIDHTACDVSATARFRQWCRSHGISYDNKENRHP